jgi:hypothetical protein
MIKHLSALILLAFISTASNCGTGPQPVPTPTPAAVCSNLKSIGCSDGNPSCTAILQQTITDNMTYVNLTCLAGATTVAAAKACGSVLCK